MMNAGMGKKRRLKKIGNLARFVKIEQETTANSPKQKNCKFGISDIFCGIRQKNLP